MGEVLSLGESISLLLTDPAYNTGSERVKKSSNYDVYYHSRYGGSAGTLVCVYDA